MRAVERAAASTGASSGIPPFSTSRATAASQTPDAFCASRSRRSCVLGFGRWLTMLHCLSTPPACEPRSPHPTAARRPGAARRAGA